MITRAVVAVALLAAGAGLISSCGGSGAPPAGAAVGTALAGVPATVATADGIPCESSEQALFHIHAHLAVYVGGRPRLIPAGIGIAAPRREEETTSGAFVVSGSCFSWLHTHTTDGIVHIESPVRRTFTLGQLFDVWSQPLGRSRVGPARGPVITFVDGRRFAGDPRNVPLAAHAVIQLDVGSPVPPPVGFGFAPGI